MLPIPMQIEMEFRKVIPKNNFNNWLITKNTELSMDTPLNALQKGEKTGNYQVLWNLIWKYQKKD